MSPPMPRTSGRRERCSRSSASWARTGDVLIARGGHRTIEIMKVLTLTSLILLPGDLIAGVMGMNSKVGLFDQAELFWVVLAAII